MTWPEALVAVKGKVPAKTKTVGGDQLVPPCMQIMDFNFLTGMREAKLATPPWLAHLGTQAQVEVNCLRVLRAFVTPQDGATDLHTLITSITGTASVRSDINMLCSNNLNAAAAKHWCIS